MKKRIVTIGLVVALLATCITGATLSYLTDTDAKTNTFTVGNVDIALLESTLHRDNNKATDEQIIADAANYETYLKVAGENIVPGEWVKKAPYVQNIGKNDAYVRIRIRFEEDELKNLYFMEYTTALDKGKITKSMALLDEKGEQIKTVASYEEAVAATGWTYVEYTYTYEEILPAAADGKASVTYYAPMWQFCVKHHLDNSELANLDLNKIEVFADAIQAEGFSSAEKAFTAFDAQ